MLRHCAIAAFTIGFLASNTCAQPPAQEPPKSPIRLLPNYVATDQPKHAAPRSEPRPGPVPLPLPTPPATMQAWEHLLIAADHLEAAGLRREADELRTRAQRRGADRPPPAALKAHEQNSSGTEQIEVRLRVIEFSEDQVREAAPELLDALLAGCQQGGSIQNQETTSRHIDELRAKGLVKTLAEPHLITPAGRPASIAAGGEFPVPSIAASGEKRTEWCEFGVRFEAVANVVSRRRLRLEFQHSIHRPDFSSTFVVHGGTVPVVSTTATKSAIEINAGETVLAGAMRSELTSRGADGKQQTETSQLLVLVTADFVRPASATEAPDPAPPIKD